MATAFLWCRKAPAGERVAPLLQVKAGEAEFSFGRDPKSNVALKWDGISRSHSQIIHLPPDEKGLASTWLVQGKEAGNGTFVNGKRICGRQQLREGDVVGFGHGHDIQVGCSVDPVALVYEFEFQHRAEITSGKNNNENAEPNQVGAIKQGAMIKPGMDAKSIGQPSTRHKTSSSSNRKVLGHLPSSPSCAPAAKPSPRTSAPQRASVGEGAPNTASICPIGRGKMGVTEGKHAAGTCTLDADVVTATCTSAKQQHASCSEPRWASQQQLALGGTRSPPKRAAGSQQTDEWPRHLEGESVQLSKLSCASKLEFKAPSSSPTPAPPRSTVGDRVSPRSATKVTVGDRVSPTKIGGAQAGEPESAGDAATEGGHRWVLEREGLLAKIWGLEREREMARTAEREGEEKEKDEERERIKRELTSAIEKEKEMAKASSMAHSEEKRRWEEERCAMAQRVQDLSNDLKEAQDLSNELKEAVQEAGESNMEGMAAADQDANGVSGELNVVMEEMRALRTGLEAEVRQMRERGEAERVKLEIQIERERADFERERMDLEAIAEKRVAQVRTMLQEEARREVGKLTKDVAKAKEEMTAARNERNSVLARAEALAKDKSVSRASEEGRIRALSDQVFKLKEAKDVIEAQRDEAVAALQKEKENTAKIKARNSGLASQVDALQQERDRHAVSSPAGTPAKKAVSRIGLVAGSPGGSSGLKVMRVEVGELREANKKLESECWVLQEAKSALALECSALRIKVAELDAAVQDAKQCAKSAACAGVEKEEVEAVGESSTVGGREGGSSGHEPRAVEWNVVVEEEDKRMSFDCVSRECSIASMGEIEALEEAKSSLEERCKTLECCNKGLEGRIAALDLRYRALQEGNDASEKRCNALQERTGQLEQQVMELRGDKVRLEQSMRALEHDKEMLTESLACHEETCAKLRDCHEEEKDALIKHSQQLSLQVEGMEADMESLRERMAYCEEQYEAGTKELGQARRELDAAAEASEIYKVELETRDAERQELVQDRDALKKALADTSSERESLSLRLIEVGTWKEQLEKTVEDLKAKQNAGNDTTHEEPRRRQQAERAACLASDSSSAHHADADADAHQPRGEGEGESIVLGSQSPSQHNDAILKPKTPPQAKDSSCRPSPRPSPSHQPSPHGRGVVQQQQQLKPEPGSSNQLKPEGGGGGEVEDEGVSINRTDACGVLHGHADSVNAVCMVTGDKGERVLASASSDCTVRLWKVAGNSGEQTMKLEANSRVWCVAGSSEASVVACGTHDGVVHVWSTSDGTLEASLKGHGGEVRSVALSHDGKMLASGAADKMVIVWRRDSNSGGWVRAREQGGRHSGSVVALSFEGGDTSLGRIASGSYDRTVRVWKAAMEGEGGGGGEEVKLTGHTHWVMGVCWVSVGPQAMVASASYDRTARLWNAKSGECLRVMREHSDRVTSIAFSVQSQVLATSSFDRSTKLWSLKSTETAPQSSLTLQHPAEVRGVCFCPSAAGGETIASASSDKAVRLWTNQ